MMEKMLLWENMLPFLVAIAKFLREGEKQQNQRTKVTRERQRIKSRQVGGRLITPEPEAVSSPQLDGLPWSGQVHLKRLGRIMLDISKALNLDLFPEMTRI